MSVAPRIPAPVRQRGMTIIGVLLVLIVIAFVALIAMRIVPIYVDYFTIRQAIEGLKSESDVKSMSREDIHKSLDRRFDVSYVDVIRGRDLKIARQGQDLVLKLVYEDRRSLIGNLDVVARFDEDVVLTR